MRYLPMLSLLALVAALLLAASFRMVEAANGRTVNLTIEVVSTDGHPFADFGVIVKSSASESPSFTDQAGKAMVQLEVAANDNAVTLTQEGLSKKGSSEQMRLSAQTWERLRHEFYFPYFNINTPTVQVPLEAGKSDYHVKLVAAPAVRINGVVTDADGRRPIRDALFRIRHASLEAPTNRPGPNGEFSVVGLPRLIENDLFILTLPFVHRVHIPAGELSEDRDIREVKVKHRYVDGASLGDMEIRIVNWPEAQKLLDYVPMGGVTLISADGKTIVALQQGGGDANEDRDLAGREFARSGWPTIPYGEYFVAPDMFRASKQQMLILDAIDHGIDLANAGIPLLKIEADKPAKITVDAAEVIRAINKLAPQIPARDASPEATTRPAT